MAEIFGVNAASGAPLPGSFPLSDQSAVSQFLVKAQNLRTTSWARDDAARAAFLRAIAAELEANRAAICARADAETALGDQRLQGELDRTCLQLRLFAEHIEVPDWRQAVTHDGSVRMIKTLLPIGPVAVFGASNFPLAYSVMGGDSASALAAGCSVIVKAHDAHPGTASLVAEAVHRAQVACQAPEGVFACHFLTHESAAKLVQHDTLAAVGFTGSLRVGRILMDLAAARRRPIPVFAEMGSMNPQFLFPGRLADDPEGLAESHFASLTLGAGQFCTNPGLAVGVAGPGWDRYRSRMITLVQESSAAVMLNASIRANYEAGCERLRAGASILAASEGAGPALFEVEAGAFLAREDLREEVFGPALLLVTTEITHDFGRIALALEGQLAVSVHAAPSDLPAATNLVRIAEHMCGRIVWNGFPTGLQVGAATVHGGPYPATSDSRFTAVGNAAIMRWLRPICYQNVPDSAL